jgi:subtilase family serine protease
MKYKILPVESPGIASRSVFKAAALVLASILAGGTTVAVAATSDSVSAPALTADASRVALPGSVRPTTDVDMGEFSSSRMTVDVVLAPSNQPELSALLAKVYDPQSPSYQQWLAKGEFYSRFAPDSAQVAAVTEYLQAQGLIVEQSSSPFLVRASGPSSTVAAAFGTALHSYRNPRGITYFSNASAIQLPTRLAAGVLGVVGVSNTVRMRSHVRDRKSTRLNSSHP